jgi:type I restriction enzyme S subunit
MKWEKVKLKDCCQKIGSGATPKGGALVYVESGTALIRSQNVYNLSFDYQGLTHINDDAAIKLSSVTVQEKDILLNITGDSVARVCQVPAQVLPARVNQHVAIIRTNEKLNSDYLAYYLASAEMQAYMLNLAVGKGASRNALTKGMIEAFPISLPPLAVQKRIADILSAYDDLIENNQKQIKLLEEAAQRLYNEWFVNFRFPGHESTPIINGIPQGWKKGILGDVAFFKRGKTITKNQTHEGVVPVVAGGLEPAYYHNQSNTASPVITVSGSGANAGFTRLYHTEIWASDCSFVDAQSTENIFFTFCTLKYKKGDIDALQKGAAQPHVYAKDINALEILIPTDELFANFKSFITPYFNKIKGLVQQIDLAIEARDRLLPKLMSGELEVE